MAGGTHIFDMIKRNKQNQELKKMKYFKKHLANAQASHDAILIDKDSWTKGDLSELERNRKRVRSRRYYRITRLILILGILAYLIYYFLSHR
jgi:hypothetical protein